MPHICFAAQKRERAQAEGVTIVICNVRVWSEVSSLVFAHHLWNHKSATFPSLDARKDLNTRSSLRASLYHCDHRHSTHFILGSTVFRRPRDCTSFAGDTGDATRKIIPPRPIVEKNVLLAKSGPKYPPENLRRSAMSWPLESLELPDLQPARKKIRQKSIRNAKASAEMARRQYHDRILSTGNASTAASSPWTTDRQISVANTGNDVTFPPRHEAQGGPSTGNALSPSRPVARQNIRSSQVSPPTPPQTSETHLPPGFYWHDGLHESAAALNRLPSGPSLVDTHDSFDSTNLTPERTSPGLQSSGGALNNERRRRSGSFGSNYLHVPKHRGFDIDTRPRTAEILSTPMLQVSIPHYRIGTPRFSERGTAFLHNSIHTAFSSTTDFRSSAFSNNEFHELFPPPPGQQHRPITSRRRSPVSWYSPSVTPQPQKQLPPPPPPMFRSSSIITPPEDPPDEEDIKDIHPSVFNSIAANPDDFRQVRYQPANKEIAAAMPARLIAEITSVKFLDYDLLSDFFLTYRSFLTPADLARFLVARLRWAVSQNDDAGQVVRVRTFVAMRHWVLNYFMDDFEPDLDLRVLFCELINQLAVDLQKRPGGGGGDLKVVCELKKCWRRTCDSVWASPPEDLSKQSPPGSRDRDNRSVATKSPIMMAGGDAERDERAARKAKNKVPAQTYFAYVSPLTARGRVVPTSPFSEQSINITSCAMPVRKRSRPILTDDKPEQTGATKDPKASPPRVPQRRSSHRHQRSGSFSDALRDDRAPVSSPKAESVERVNSPEPSVPGDLIRGFSLKPNPSNVVFPAPLSPPITDDQQDGSQTNLLHADPANNPAMVKLFGSMRRALSTRQSSKASLSGGHKATSSGDLRNLRSIDRQPRRLLSRDLTRRAQEIRSDALAAIVVRSYEQNLLGSTDDPERGPQVPPKDDPTPVSSSRILVPAPKRPLELSRFNSHVTTGSRSIVIFDDTGIPEAERTPDLESQFTGLTWSGDKLVKKTRPDTAEHYQQAIRDMAMNNTAFLLPDPRISFAHGYWSSSNSQAMARSTASIATTMTTAPHSPPPTGPLPPLPGMSTVLASRTQLSRESLRPSTRSGPPASLELSDAVLDDMDLQPKSETEDDSFKSAVYRRSSFVNPSEFSLPSRTLRRKPGGDLRAIDTVQNLGLRHRRQSTGSLSTPGASSPTSTVLSGETADLQIASVIAGRRLRGRVTDGQLIETARKSSLRLLSTHSSQPNMRASFEAEVRRLAMIPTGDDDGDIETTLLKLEGKFLPRRPSTATLKSLDDEYDLPDLMRQNERAHVRVIGHPDHPETSRLTLGSRAGSAMTETQGASIYHLSQSSVGSAGKGPSATSNSEGSDSLSVPLESDLAKQLRKQRRSSTLPPSSEGQRSNSRSKVLQFKDDPPVTARSSRRGHKKSKSESAAIKGHARDDSGATSSTFLLDENESLYDGASFVSRASSQDRPSTGRSFFLEEDAEEDEDEENEEMNIAESEVLNFASKHHPPTPPATIGASSEHAPDEEILLPGPAPSADLRHSFQFPERQSPECDQGNPLQVATPALRNPHSSPALRVSPTRPLPTHHTPFILAFRSAVLAAQMTLIEKDALDCIDWKDLVNLQWSQNTISIRDWASFLHNSSSDKVSSIDLIITRFNLVIKWCISSVLLCGTALERMQCIVKFIHIAVYARKRLRNFATAAQLTIALCSCDLSRLSSTWDLVPTIEKDALKSLEELVSPVRNFAALRAEMETAAAGVDDAAQPTAEGRGVIPFLGVYTRDLALNAQNPAFVAAQADEEVPQEEKLVNFERHRTAACIVKGVLRLLDASAKYTIRPDPEVLSRSLWLATLGDGEITSLSKGLE